MESANNHILVDQVKAQWKYFSSNCEAMLMLPCVFVNYYPFIRIFYQYQKYGKNRRSQIENGTMSVDFTS